MSEPSHLGAYATCALAFSASQLTRVSGWKFAAYAGVLTASCLCIRFSVSGTAVVACSILAGLAIAVAVYRVLRRGWISILAGYVSLGVVASSAILGSAFVTFFQNVVDTKTDSTSFASRSLSDENALRILGDSWSIGIGLGSNRSSSLVSLLLAAVGVVGTCLFLISVILMIRSNLRPGGNHAAGWALAGASIAAAVSVADLTSPLLWISFAVCYATYSQTKADGYSEPNVKNLKTLNRGNTPYASDQRKKSELIA